MNGLPEGGAAVVYDGLGWELLLDNPAWLSVILVLALAACGAAVACWLRERPALRRGGLLLLALRLIAIAALATLLVEPQRRSVTPRVEPSRVVLLSDHSASMRLPASDASGATRGDAAEEALRRVDRLLRPDHTPRAAAFAASLAYGDEPPGADATRLGAALEQVLADHSATPLAAVFVATDGGWNAGSDPREAAPAALARGVPVHTIGVGPRDEPPRTELRDLAAPSRAAVGDRFSVSVTVATNQRAAAEGNEIDVAISLAPLAVDDSTGPRVAEESVSLSPPSQGGLVSKKVELQGASPGRHVIVAELVDPSGADAAGQTMRAVVELIDQPTRVLLAASGPSRDYRFLRDQLFRDDQFEADVLLQSAAGAITQDANRVLDAFPTTADELDPYDAVVAIDVDWRRVDDGSLGALSQWVSRGGGGLVVVAGRVGLMPSLRSGLAAPLRTLVPVALRDDPLALNDAITPNRDPEPVALTRPGEQLGWLAGRGASSDSDSLWEEFPGFYASLPPAEPKPGATVLARLGEQDNAPPLLVEGFYGAGRVVYLGAPETWRLRTVDPAWFTELHTGLLRHISQGRLRGAAAAGVLLFDRQRYSLGEPLRLRFIDRTPGEAPPSLVARLSVDDSPPTETPLDPVADEPGAYAATLRPEKTGRYTAALRTPLGDVLSATAEVTLPSLESETTVQNAALLRELAESTGGVYIDLADVDAPQRLDRLAAATPSAAETSVELGPPDERFARRVAQWSLGVMAGALLIEWSLRRLWRLA
ncbi:vWA domain-containing protein [Botrimarina sp.]|uniref:vWA domain-containing protein n=1 Tax=Botrimarina sp. TaxID=2795802 RepID=UPI0032EE2102